MSTVTTEARTPFRIWSGWVSAVSLLVGIALWELVGRIWDVSFFPPFSLVIEQLVELVRTGQILGNLATSLGNLGIGFGI